MEFKAPKRSKIVYQIRSIVISAALIAVFGFLYGYYRKWGLLVGMIIIAAVCLFAVVFYIPRYFSAFFISVNQSGIVLKKGVFIKREYILPYVRFVYAQSFQTPLGFLFGLKGIVFAATGKKVIMDEICQKNAEDIIDFLNLEKSDEL